MCASAHVRPCMCFVTHTHPRMHVLHCNALHCTKHVIVISDSSLESKTCQNICSVGSVNHVSAALLSGRQTGGGTGVTVKRGYLHGMGIASCAAPCPRSGSKMSGSTMANGSKKRSRRRNRRRKKGRRADRKRQCDYNHFGSVAIPTCSQLDLQMAASNRFHASVWSVAEDFAEHAVASGSVAEAFAEAGAGKGDLDGRGCCRGWRRHG